jgi:hypothetical protein
MEIARQEDPQEQLRLWDAIKSGGMTVRATREAKKKKRQPDVAIMQIRRALSAGKSFMQKLSEIEDDKDFFGADQSIEKLTELRDKLNTYYHKVYADPWLSLQTYATEMEEFLDYDELQNAKHRQYANDAIKKAEELRDKLSALLDKIHVEK